MPALTLALEKTPGLGSKIDLVLTFIRIGFFFWDQTLIKDNLAKADEFVPFHFQFYSYPDPDLKAN